MTTDRDLLKNLGLISRELSLARIDPITRHYGADIPLTPYVERFRRAMGTRTSLDVEDACERLPVAELQAIEREVEAELPGFPEPPPLPVCTCCQADRFDARNPPEGYRFDRPRDPEDGPGQWEYYGRPAVCEKCLSEDDLDPNVAWGEAAEAQLMAPEAEEAYERYCIGQGLYGELLACVKDDENRCERCGGSHHKTDCPWEE